MATRYNINDFALANPAYVGATVSFWTVSGGAKTATLATLYAASTGSTTLTNPRTLDSDGKFSVPVYIEVPTIATVSGLTVADHDTGIMGLAESAAATSATAAAASAAAAAASAASIDYGSVIHGAAAATLDSADEFGFWDSAAAATRKITYANFRPFSSGIAGIDLEKFGMVGDGTTDCTAAFNAGLAYAIANNISTMHLPPKNSAYTYRFASKPNAVTSNIRLIGAKSETCILLRDYNAGSSSEAFIDMSDGGGCEGLSIIAANGTTGGIGIVSKPATTSGFQKFEGLNITYAGTGAWGDACMLLSGADATDGLRDTLLSNSWLFGKLIIDHCINIGGAGLYAGDVIVRATNADAASDPGAQVALNFIAATSINVSNTYNFFITTAYLANAASAIVIASTAVHGTVMSGTYISDANISNSGTYVDVNTQKTAVSTSATKTMGYGTGAGGAVTQATSKSTAVTLNKPTGRITTHDASLAAGASVVFAFNNSLLASTDALILNLANQAGNYEWRAGNVSAGLIYVYITNITAGPLAEALTFNFAILKGVEA